MIETSKFRQMTWNCSACRCSAILILEQERIQVKPCSYDHIKYCILVAIEVFTKRVSQIPTITKRDIRDINEAVLVWKDKFMFFRPLDIKYESNGLGAYQAYQDWDGRGITDSNYSYPKYCEEPELLADLVQAKLCKDFQIDQWVETYKQRDEYNIWPEEYLSHPGMTNVLFRTIFRRNPTYSVAQSLYSDLSELRRRFEFNDYKYVVIARWLELLDLYVNAKLIYKRVK